MAAPDERRKNSDDEDDTPAAWSSPRPSPGAMGAAHDDLFGVPTPGPGEPASDVDVDAADAETPDAETPGAEPDAETDVEGDAGEERGGRSVGAEETDVEGGSGATDPDGDGSRTSAG